MKRKPTTKQTVRRELARMVTRQLTEVRTTVYEQICASTADNTRGAIYLALHAAIIDEATFDALCALVSNARYERGIELIYGQPPYTGSAFAEARRDAAKAAA